MNPIFLKISKFYLILTLSQMLFKIDIFSFFFRMNPKHIYISLVFLHSVLVVIFYIKWLFSWGKETSVSYFIPFEGSEDRNSLLSYHCFCCKFSHSLALFLYHFKKFFSKKISFIPITAHLRIKCHINPGICSNTDKHFIKTGSVIYEFSD